MLCIPSAPRVPNEADCLGDARQWEVEGLRWIFLIQNIKIRYCTGGMDRKMDIKRVGRQFLSPCPPSLFLFFISVGFHFKDSEGILLALSRLLQHTREWMKQLSHLNTHSGNPPLSTMPGQNRKSINTYNAFYLLSNSTPFTESSICDDVESRATCHWWLFVVWQFLRKGAWEVVKIH